MKFSLVLVIALASYAVGSIAAPPDLATPTAALPGLGNSGPLKVNCGGKAAKGTFTTIAAAISSLQSRGSGGQNSITVSGACNENVVIQSMDRLTLTANPGASITDASGGNAFVIAVLDSRGVSINNFTISGDGIICSDGSLCHLNGNNITAFGVAIHVEMSQAVVTGGSVQGADFAAINVINGSRAEVTGVMITNNPGNGIQVLAQSFVVTDSTISNNGGAGAFITHNGMLRCVGCQITGNGAQGVIVKRDSSARFQQPYVITGNTNGGVQITESSSAYFSTPGTVTGNPGGMDVVCGSSFATARGATVNIGGGTTNCTEPPE